MNVLWFLSEFRNPVTEALALAITECGYETVLIVLICIVFWCFDKKAAYKAGFTFCISGLAVQGLKLWFRIPRPWILDTKFKPVPKAVKAATGYSFPSGHTQSATSIYGSFFTSTKEKWQKLLCVILPVLVGFSRMILGVHTPKDVGCAFCVALVSIPLINCLYTFMEEKQGFLRLLLPAIFIIGSLLCVLEGAWLYSKGAVNYENTVDCCKTAGAALGFLLGFWTEKKWIIFSLPENKKQGILRFIIGILLVLAIKLILKAVFPENLFWSGFRNMLLVLFITAGYPFVFEKLINQKRNGSAYEK